MSQASQAPTATSKEIFKIRLRIFDFDNTITKEEQPNFNAHVYEKIRATISKKLGRKVPIKEITELGLKSYREHGHSAIGLAAHYNMVIDELYDGYHFRKKPGINQCDRGHTDSLKAFCKRALEAGNSLRHCILTHSTMDWTVRSLAFLDKQKGVKKLKRIFSEKAGTIFTAEQYRFADRLGNVTQFFKGASFMPFWLVCARMNVDPRECSMVEDSLRNLAIAKQLGMQTIYIHHGKPLPANELPAYVDHQIASLRELETIPQEHSVRADLTFEQFIKTEFNKAKAFFAKDNQNKRVADWEFATPEAA